MRGCPTTREWRQKWLTPPRTLVLRGAWTAFLLIKCCLVTQLPPLLSTKSATSAMELEIERLGFRYENLASEHTIRILLLHPAPNHSDTLEFDLDHYERPDILRESPSTPLHYDAISYFWGEPDFKHRMRCREQGTHLKITSRVDNMLRYLRKATAPRFLWIDAICLNQANREEKGIQIQKMGEIYTQARKVRVWLGAADGDTPKTFAPRPEIHAPWCW